MLCVNSKKDMKNVKSVKSNIVARTITFDDYTRCLQDEIEMNDAKTVLHKIEITRDVHYVGNENCSKSVRR